MTAGGDVGILGRLTIWIDDTGESPNWYLEQVKRDSFEFAPFRIDPVNLAKFVFVYSSTCVIFTRLVLIRNIPFGN